MLCRTLTPSCAWQEFLREANLMVSLKHRNVVSLLGICLPPDLMIVQELMPLGSMQGREGWSMETLPGLVLINLFGW